MVKGVVTVQVSFPERDLQEFKHDKVHIAVAKAIMKGNFKKLSLMFSTPKGTRKILSKRGVGYG